MFLLTIQPLILFSIYPRGKGADAAWRKIKKLKKKSACAVAQAGFSCFSLSLFLYSKRFLATPFLEKGACISFLQDAHIYFPNFSCNIL
jgi:hypothetical protein